MLCNGLDFWKHGKLALGGCLLDFGPDVRVEGAGAHREGENAVVISHCIGKSDKI